MDRIINYSSTGPPSSYPTSNSEYGRGVITSMQRTRAGPPPPMYFDPAASNYFLPQVGQNVAQASPEGTPMYMSQYNQPQTEEGGIESQAAVDVPTDLGNPSKNLNSAMERGNYESGDSGGDVMVSGLPMNRNPKWRQAPPSIPIYNGHAPIKPPNVPAPRLCGRCPKCNDIKDPNSRIAPLMNFKEEGLTGTGARRFPPPSASNTNVKKNQGVKKMTPRRPFTSTHPRSLPIQGTMDPTGPNL